MLWVRGAPEPLPQAAAPLPAPTAPPDPSGPEPFVGRLDLRCSNSIFERGVLIRRLGPDAT